MFGSSVRWACAHSGGDCINASTVVTALITEWFHFIQWLWNFADSIIIYQSITLLDVCIFAAVASLTIEVILWVNSKSTGDDE